MNPQAITANEIKPTGNGLVKHPASPLTETSGSPTLPVPSDTAKVFLREFTRELIREISVKTKILVLFAVLAVVGGIYYLASSAYNSYQAQQQTNLRLLASQNQRIDAHEGRLGQLSDLADRNSQRILELKQADLELGKANPAVGPSRMSLAPMLWNSYRNGVCMIAGSYIFIDPGTGLPLRYPENQPSEAEQLLTTGTQDQLTPYGNGSLVEMEFVGTGFHVGEGFVLTNRHVASSPWLADAQAQLIISISGAAPRMQKLWAFFPGQTSARDLRFIRSAANQDLAVSRLVQTAADLPALPLDRNSSSIQVGQAVVVMGYPTGPNRMLALLPEAEARGLQQEYGGSLMTLLGELARRKMIKPLTTQGYITDLYTDRIVFDAATTEGGSGTPMFGESGQVIGITFAEFIGERASNFAVPVESAVQLLHLSGWRAPTARTKT